MGIMKLQVPSGDLKVRIRAVHFWSMKRAPEKEVSKAWESL